MPKVKVGDIKIYYEIHGEGEPFVMILGASASKVPALVIHGDADRIVPVENARILASRIPGAELVTFKNAGHLLIEAGDEPNRIILDFLKRHRNSS